MTHPRAAAPVPSPAPFTEDALVRATSQIVSAYLTSRPGEAVNLPALMAEVYGTLRGLAEQPATACDGATDAPKPVVTVEDSVKNDYLVCLEDGKRVKMLRRYLKTTYNMTPEQYRARWSLPASYPMVAPNYAKVRSKLAKEIGLGRRGMPAVAKRMLEVTELARAA